MDRDKIRKQLQKHIEEEATLERKINREKNPSKSYKIMSRLYKLRTTISVLFNLYNRAPHNKGEHEFDASNPNYDKIEYDKVDRK